MIRDSGYYAVIEGRECYVSILGADYVKVPTPTGVVRLALSDVEKVIRVATKATWRGARVATTTIGPEGVGFFTDDRALAEAEGLHGDFYSGWDGVAPVSELTDVSERVSVIHPRKDLS